jgi:hypothetical protein
LPRMPFPEVMQTLSALEERAFTASRLRLLGCLALTLVAVAFLWAACTGQSVVTRAGTPSSADFSFIYASGLTAASARPAAVYDSAAFAAAQARLTGPRVDGLPYYHFLYPPIFLLVTFGLGLLPFLLAAGVWIGGTLLLYLAALRAIAPQGWLLLFAAIPLPILKNAQLGQNGFLTAGLLGLSLALIERHPVAAGISLGLLTYKPQFGVLFPLALVAAGKWRVIVSAAATSVMLVLAAAVAFGRNLWPAYLDSLHEFDARLSPDQQVAFQYQSVFGWLQTHGPAAATIAQLIIAAAVAAIVWTMWRREAPAPLRAAVLAAGSAIVTPYVLTYDLGILAIALAFLVRDGLERGFLPGERLLLALGVATSFLLTAPVAPALDALLISISVWRWRAIRELGAPAVRSDVSGFETRGRLAASDKLVGR